MMMKFNLAKIENQLQTLVEGSMLKLFSMTNPLGELANQMALALIGGLHAGPNNKIIVPDVYTIFVHPAYYKKLKSQNDWQETLLARIRSEADIIGGTFINLPVIQLVEDLTLSPQKVEITAQISSDRITTTTDLGIEFLEEEKNYPQNAFLIVNGKQMVPLDRPVINIGRRPDNDLIVNDPRVSRVHAQIRSVKGHFVIFDLNSTGGTTVNGQSIRQCLLSPGDVIGLAGVPLVYGQESNPISETDQWIADSSAMSI